MENIEFGISVSLLGFAVVIATLFLLYILINLFGAVFNHQQKGSENNFRTNKEEQIAMNSSSVSPQVTAVIAAAVSAAWEYPGRPFKVTIMPKPIDNNGWVMFGRKQQMDGRRRLETIWRQKPF